MRQSEAYHREQVLGNQPGDPAKAAAAVIQVAGEVEAPLHLLLGQDAYDLATGKLQSLTEETAKWKSLTVSTGFEAEVAA